MTALARAVQLAGPAAAIGLSRAAAMALSLGAVTLTYYTLSPLHFTFFNLVMFFVAISSAVAAPLNRAFWSGDSAARYAPASLSSAAVSALVVGAGILLASTAGVAVRLFVAAAAILYAVARIVERYGYGKLLTAGSGSRSIRPILYFAIADLAVAAALWIAAYDSLPARIAIPPLAFLILVAGSGCRSLLSELMPTRERTREAFRFARHQLASSTGLKVIALGAIATAAGAGDRLLAAHLHLESAQFAAAFLLAVSYGIALQTLTAFVFDISRMHVFHNGTWQPQARQFSLLCTGIVLGISVAALAAYPLLVAVRLLPDLVGPVLWAAILVRSASVTLVYILNVDHFQMGEFRPLLAADLLILIGGTCTFVLLHLGYSQPVAASVMIATGCLTSVLLGWLHYRRLA